MTLEALLARLLANRSQPIRASALNLLAEFRMSRAVRVSSRQFKTLKGRRDIRLHLGCGQELKDGWVNLDLDLNRWVPAIPEGASPDTRFILYDLRAGTVPLEDGSCALIYSSHFFEHLECEVGFRLMRDCYRLLASGGVFRAALPTFRNMFRAYLDNDHGYFKHNIYKVFPKLPKGTATLVDQVNWGVYQHGEHKCIYDEEKARLLLKKIGFNSVEVVPYREGLDPAHELRRRYSFYVEAVK